MGQEERLLLLTCLSHRGHHSHLSAWQMLDRSVIRGAIQGGTYRWRNRFWHESNYVGCVLSESPGQIDRCPRGMRSPWQVCWALPGRACG